MRWRALFVVSLVVNVGLAVAWIAATRRPAAVEPAVSPVVVAKTNVVVRRQFFSWAEVESSDYPTFIANLRDIACPEQTIRDIIIADINTLFTRRLATEVITPEQQWWRSNPDPAIVQAATARGRALDDERRALLARLLGPNWEGGDLANIPRPSRPGVALDGPVLGVLPLEVKQAVEQASATAQDRLEAYLEAQKQLGKTPDPLEIAKLRQQTRQELASILTPVQLEEYLLRYSQNANTLRSQLGQLKYFEASADEFRQLFRATDSIDQQLELLSPDDPSSALARNNLLQQRENAIKTALGLNRYEQYTLLHDPIYQNSYAAAQQAGLPELADTLYEINLAVAQEQANVRANTNLTTEQKAIELKRIELEQLKANATAMGQPQPPEPPVVRTFPTTPHVIRSGETVATVSLETGIPISTIKAANPDLDFNQLHPGDTIRIPQSFLTLPPGTTGP